MPQTAYPSDTDLAQLLTATGLTVPDTLDMESKVVAAAAEWEMRTGWYPYLAAAYTEADVLAAEAAAAARIASGLPPLVGAPVVTLGAPIVTTRLFDPPSAASAGRSGGSRGGHSLWLETGLLSLVSLAVGVVPDPTGNYANSNPGTAGTILTPNLNFYLRPQNAAAKGLAITEIEFLSPIRGVPQSIAVTGVFGRVLALPDDVWQVILQKAALECLPELGISLTNGIVKIEDVQYLTSSGGSPLLNAAAQWGANFNKQVNLKKRITV